MQITGERQIAPTVEGIRADHVERYRWAAEQLPPNSRVVDFACGVGYGTQILQDAGHVATGYDKAADALAYARKFYGRAQYRMADGVCPLRACDAAVCFETIEHLADPRPLLESFAGARLLLASVPNEAVLPYGEGFGFHHRHYTKAEFAALLQECGWMVREWWGQRGAEGEEAAVERAVEGRTLIAVAERTMAQQPAVAPPVLREVKTDPPAGAEVGADFPVPEHVAILGLGPSLERYVDLTKRLGGKHAYCDEVWGINAVGGVLMCDRVFHMDDVRVQERRAAAQPDSNIARMLEWLRLHPGPIITSRAHPDYPGLVAFPLEAVLNDLKHAYFNSTASYAIAYAIHLGVRKLSLFGMDFTYPNAHHAEKGRACVEFWLGVAASRGIALRIPQESSLMDALHTQAERLYGYDTLDVTIRSDGERAFVDLVERDTVPSAAEIEERYDHSVHPNAMVGQAK